MEAISVADRVEVPNGHVLQVDLSRALPPTSSTMSPGDLDASVGGGFFAGPWAGYRSLVYPPSPPEEEVSTVAEELATKKGMSQRKADPNNLFANVWNRK